MASIEEIVRRIVREEVRAALGQPAPPPAEPTRFDASGGSLSAEEAAEYMGGAPITADTMKALARRQQIAHIKVGRATVFPVAALDAYIEEHTVKPVENPWGLTEQALRNIRAGRVGKPRGRRAE